MKLNKLFEQAKPIEIKSIMNDSRIASEKACFFTLKGMVFDGHRFIDQAIKNGAVAIVHSDPVTPVPNIEYIQVKDVAKALNHAASLFYGEPSKQLHVFGVTGTNGKSTVASLMQYFNNSIEKTGYIGTIAITYGDVKKSALLTTPDTVAIHQLCAEMVKDKVKAVSLEVSSIGLEQKRVDTLAFDVAVFTNLTHDHLDYHGTMQNYFMAKAKLFEMLPEESVSVINIDDPYGVDLLDFPKGKIVTYGESEEADYEITNIELKHNQSAFTILDHYRNESIDIETNLVAKFNVLNCTAALVAVANYHQISIKQLAHLCVTIPQIEGRMEVIKHDEPFNVIVDFAHTPDGFTQCFEYAQSITPTNGRIIVVFGSAGKRDTKKRKVLGEIADQYCDLIILTEEDQRDEDVEAINRQIASGIKSANYVMINDRVTAINQAISLAKNNDTVLILGKGDETYLDKQFGKETYSGDHMIAKASLMAKKSQKEKFKDE